jgi:glycoprotein endo-alpha-1,2-mannosidase
MNQNISELLYSYTHSPFDEEGEISPNKDTTTTASLSEGSSNTDDNDCSDWQLRDLMDDIELQMNEQNDAIVGMAKQLEDIEASLAHHGSSRLSSKRFSFNKNNSSYIPMDDEVGEKDSLNRDLANDPPKTSGKKSSILSVLRKKTSSIARLRGREAEDDGANDGQEKDRPLSRSDPTSTYDLEVATTTSSSTRRACNSSRPVENVPQKSQTPTQVTSPALAPSHQTQKSRRHLKLHPTKSQLPVQQEELPPPPSSLSGATMNSRGHVSVNFRFPPAVPIQDMSQNPKHMESSKTWEESESESNPDSDDCDDGVSELENTTITGSKTWVTIRSRKAKIALLLLSFTLMLLIGLLMGQWAQGRDSNQALQQQPQSQEQTSFGSTSVPSTVSPSDTSPDTTDSSSVETTGSESEASSSVAPTETSQITAAPTEAGDPSSPDYDYTANSDYLVGVYYYPWHGDNFHNGDGYLRKQLTPQHQPVLGEYNDSDPNVIAQHMKWFRQANIGLLVISWWGPNRLEDTNTKDVIMEHEDVGNLKIALHYETSGRLGDGTEKMQNAKTDIEYMCEHYFDHPNYYKIDGRPVIFIYISRKLEAVGTLEEALLTMRSTANKCGQSLFLIGDSVFESAPNPTVPHVPFWYFDAVTNYDVYGSAGRPEGHVGMEQVDNYYLQQAEWKKQALKEDCHYIPAVSPGYNDRAVRMQNDHPPLSRRITANAEEGSLLHYQLKHAKELADSKVDKMILVNSFNEWHEDTVSGGQNLF